MTWKPNTNDSETNQQYYLVNGIWTISKTYHGEWRYHLYKGKDKIGTYNSFGEAQVNQERRNVRV